LSYVVVELYRSKMINSHIAVFSRFVRYVIAKNKYDNFV